MDRKVFRGMLTIFALALYIAAIFLPWLSERSMYISPLQIWPPPPVVSTKGLFWSFQAVIRTYSVWYEPSVQTYPSHLFFCSYWFEPSGIHRGWLGVFVFQVLTIVSVFIGVIAIFKEKKKGRQLHVIATAVVSMIAPILCVYQRSKQMERSGLVDTTEFSLGFWLAITSAILFFVSFWISSWTERRVSKSKAEPIL